MIQLAQLSVVVGQQTLLDSLSTTLSAGQLTAVLGPNGAGKTTLLHCLTKDLTPTSGLITWQERDLQSYSLAEMAQQRAVLAQAVSLNFAFSVAQIIELGLEQNQTVPAGKRQFVLETLSEWFDLAALLTRNYLTLSGGEQQRCQFARVLAQVYRLDGQYQGVWLFLDEWTNGLDLKHQQQIACRLHQWRQQGMSIVMVAHDLNLVLQLADECLLLKSGQLVYQGAPQQVLTAETIESVYDAKVSLWRQGEQAGQVKNHQTWVQVFSSNMPGD